MKKHIVELNDSEACVLERLLRKGWHSASVRNRAQVLLLSHRGQPDEAIQQSVGINTRNVRSIRRRYATLGFEKCLYGLPRSGRPRECDASDEAQLAALACSAPPQGHSRWTLSLLRSHLKKPIGLTQVHLLLKKTAASRGAKRCGASGR